MPQRGILRQRTLRNKREKGSLQNGPSLTRRVWWLCQSTHKGLFPCPSTQKSSSTGSNPLKSSPLQVAKAISSSKAHSRKQTITQAADSDDPLRF